MRRFRSMGTTVTMATQGGEDLLDDAAHIFFRVEERLSRFRPESELSRLNREGRLENPSPELLAALAVAEEGFKLTAGLFDPRVGRLLRGFGYDRDFSLLASAEDEWPPPLPQGAGLGEAVSAGASGRGWWRVEGDLVVLDPGVEIDLGGVAKGLTVDWAAEVLRDEGAFFVEAGGDMVLGEPLEECWRVGVEDPLDPSRDLLVLGLGGGAVASSSVTKRRWVLAGAFYHHLVDPRTGQPATSALAATALAPTCARAEVLAKAALLLGPSGGPLFLHRLGARGVVVGKGGSVFASPGFGDLLLSGEVLEVVGVLGGGSREAWAASAVTW